MRVLLVHQGLQSFVQTDLDILREAHDVRAYYVPGARQGMRHLLASLPGLAKNVKWCDLSFSWFGKLHAFFAVLFSKLLGKKSIVVVSGGEVCRFDIAGKYRSICSHPLKKWFPYFTVRHADMVLPVSKYVLQETKETAKLDHSVKIRMIHHGFDHESLLRKPDSKKESLVVTVGELSDENLHRKRLQYFVETARLMPDVQFALIGPDSDGTKQLLERNASPNMRLPGGVYGADLAGALSKAMVYVQASEWESFGCAVAEAMLCECVPVVSNRTALPEVVGDCGIYLEEPVTPEEIARKIRVALGSPQLGKRARQRVIENFPLHKRQRELLEAIASLANAGGSGASPAR